MPLAAAARAMLAAQGYEGALVSIPSRSLFAAQDPAYRAMVLGTAPRVYFGSATRFAGLAGADDAVVDLDRPDDLARNVQRLCARLHATQASLDAGPGG